MYSECETRKSYNWKLECVRFRVIYTTLGIHIHCSLCLGILVVTLCLLGSHITVRVILNDLSFVYACSQSITVYLINPTSDNQSTDKLEGDKTPWRNALGRRASTGYFDLVKHSIKSNYYSFRTLNSWAVIYKAICHFCSKWNTNVSVYFSSKYQLRIE